MKKFICILAAALTVVACGTKEDDIPDRIDPGKGDKTEKYNDLGFTPHKDGDPYNTYEGLVMAGYQGWFCTPTCGCNHKCWYHYQENSQFKPGVLKNSIDFWPDTEEYETTYETAFTLPDGSKAPIYSPYDKSSVMLHFKWMKEYGIDGVYMQRFVGEVVANPNGKSHFDKVLDNAMDASNTYQRVICVMYDLGGFMSNSSRNVDALVADAIDLYDRYDLSDRTKQKYYLYENGKPLIALWGVGFNDNRPYSYADVESVMDQLIEKGYSIMLGVPTHWRTLSGDCLSDKKLHELIKKADVFFPWFVGRYDNSSYDNFKSLIPSDLKWAQDNKKVYAPLAFPGFSWTHMAPQSQSYTRAKGEFLWKQGYNAISMGAKCFYIAMFDEIDEGTAIFKVLNKKDVPSNQPDPDYYVYYNGSKCTIWGSKPKTDLKTGEWCELCSSLNIPFQGIDDDLPTDHYLWLTGQIRAMLRGEIPMQSKIPTRK